MSDQVEFVAQAQILGEVGLVIDTPTPIDMLEVSLDNLDCLVIMTVKAGFSGQSFMEEMLDKVKEIRKRSQITIELDGGINDKTIIEGIKSGANRFVATSFIFKNENPSNQFQLLNNCLGIKYF